MEVQHIKSTLVGGFLERMVASVKDCLRKTLGNARLSYEELLTVLAEVECKLNARPLTYEYNEVHGEVLTPSHFIYGRRIKSLPDEITEPDDVVMKIDVLHGLNIYKHPIKSLLEPVAKGIFSQFERISYM